jgi:hypothetical protein
MTLATSPSNPTPTAAASETGRVEEAAKGDGLVGAVVEDGDGAGRLAEAGD